MQAPQRDTQWGPTQVLLEAAREAAAALAEAGFPVELREPNLPVYAEEGESKRLAKKHGATGDDFEWRGDPYVILQDRARLVELCAFVRDRLGYETIIDVTAVDYDAADEELWGVYCLMSIRHKCRLTLKVFIPKNDCRIASITGVYPGANWHERETGEFFGITYVGHPDPRHILLPDDWTGYPLRKDYEFPEEYHGVSCL